MSLAKLLRMSDVGAFIKAHARYLECGEPNESHSSRYDDDNDSEPPCAGFGDRGIHEVKSDVARFGRAQECCSSGRTKR